MFKKLKRLKRVTLENCLQNCHGGIADSLLIAFLVVICLVAGGLLFLKISHIDLFKKNPPATSPATAEIVKDTPPPLVDACAKAKRTESFPIAFEKIESVNNGQLKTALINPKYCVTAGDLQIKVRTPYDDNFSGIYITSGLVTIKSIAHYDSQQIPEEELQPFLAGKTFIDYRQSLIKYLESNGLTHKRWSVVHFDLKTPVQLRSLRATPNELEFAQVIDFVDMQKLESQGAKIVDVRLTAQFNANHLPQAINLPYAKSVDYAHASWANFSKKETFNTSLLPNATPLIFMGASEFDIAPVRALIFTSRAGFKNLFWYRGGEADRRKLNVETGMTYPNIETVDAKKTMDFISSKSGLTVDVRTGAEFKNDHLPNAIHAKYSEVSSEPLQPSELNFKSLKNIGDTFKSKDLGSANKSVLIYGADEFDFRAIKAAIWLQGNGWKNILWFRNGTKDPLLKNLKKTDTTQNSK